MVETEACPSGFYRRPVGIVGGSNSGEGKKNPLNAPQSSVICHKCAVVETCSGGEVQTAGHHLFVALKPQISRKKSVPFISS